MTTRATYSMHHSRVSQNFYERDTHVVAQALLGKVLVRRWRNTLLAGRIVETESYVGENDAACHAARGKTKRNAVMFGRAGHAYVYLIYGIHNCLNIVTEQENFAAAVLVRALAPIDRQPPTVNMSGPGRLTAALSITRTLNGEDMITSDRLFIADDGFRVAPGDIATAARIGVEYAGADALLPWRYFLANSPYVSRRAATPRIYSK